MFRLVAGGSLRYATATITKATRSTAGEQDGDQTGEDPPF